MAHTFKGVFLEIAKQKHRIDVFHDFVTVSAISIHNAVRKDDNLEQEYLQIIKGYQKEDVDRFCQLLGIFIGLLDDEPSDVLGRMYMDFNFSSAENGQYFTPSVLCELMTELTYTPPSTKHPFATVHDPACGSGAMLLAYVKKLIAEGHNPAQSLWISAIDINRFVGLMAYLQLSLWNVPAEIIIGNSLTLKFEETWYTPAYYLNDWSNRIKFQKEREAIDVLLAEPAIKRSVEPKNETATSMTETSSNQIASKPQSLIEEQSSFDFL